MRLSARQARLLAAVAAGHVLKVHRTLDGDKRYRLHRLQGTIDEIDASTIEGLVGRGLLASNMKFPAATFLLTDAGRTFVQQESIPAQARSEDS